MSLSAKTISIVKATAPVVGAHAREITDIFYRNMFLNNPEVLAFFNKANQTAGRQQQALANAIVAYGTNIDSLSALTPAIKLISMKHCGLQVLPCHYSIVHENLMNAVSIVLKDALTPEIAQAWNESVKFLAQVLIVEEEKLYKAAEEQSGGWRGWKNFVITSIKRETDNVATFTFKPEVTSNNGPFVFQAGQYLSVSVDAMKDGSLTAPRHYTITSKSGEDFLQVTTKRLQNGVVSRYMHNELKVGDIIRLSPPFGSYTIPDDVTPIVCISAGIGMTPVKAFIDTHGSRISRVVHVDKTTADVPFFQHFKTKYSDKIVYLYSQTGSGRPTASSIIDSAMKDVDTNAKYYLCGPTPFLCEVARELRKNGVCAENVIWEAFSPAMACPM